MGNVRIGLEVDGIFEVGCMVGFGRGFLGLVLEIKSRRCQVLRVHIFGVGGPSEEKK